MNIIFNSKLFVDTLQNVKYLDEDAIILGLKERGAFWGIPYTVNKIASNSVVRQLLIILFPLILISYLLLKFLITGIKATLRKKKQLKVDSYYILAAPFSRSINNRINKHASNACWILNDGINEKDYIIPSGKFVCSYELIGIIDIFLSVIESFVAYILIIRKYGTYYMLASLNAFRWLNYLKTCNHIPDSSVIYFNNHKDRWAFLEDTITCKYKILIQHGTEVSNCDEDLARKRGMLHVVGGGWTQNLPHKYQTLNEVITFSDKEFSAMSQSIFHGSPECVIGGYGFETYPLESDKYSVLIIAHSGIYYDIEKKLIDLLSQLSIDLYVKNHPTQSNEKYEELLKVYKFHLITEQKFPHVNKVITYDSTLAHEYMSVGIDVIYHTNRSVEQIVEAIKVEL